jgi:hypothetical protein
MTKIKPTQQITINLYVFLGLIAALFTLIGICIYLSNRKVDTTDIKVVNDNIKLLQQQNDSLNKVIINNAIEVKGYKHKIDSLAKLKPIIQTYYVKKSNEIDAGSVGYVINEYNSIFTKHGIKH